MNYSKSIKLHLIGQNEKKWEWKSMGMGMKME